MSDSIRIAGYDENQLLTRFAEQHARLAQLDLERRDRSITARNYNSSILALGDFLARQPEGQRLPTKGTLQMWRDAMHVGRIRGPNNAPYSLRTINARLSAARKLLNSMADEAVEMELKMALRDWATVADLKPVIEQDKTEEDYGRRLSVEAVQDLIRSLPTGHKGLRDRAILALGFGAGLRISEIVALTIRDAFHTQNATGQKAIAVRHGKHGKSRKVVMPGWQNWVFQAVRAYIVDLGLDPDQPSPVRIFRGVKSITDGHKPVGTSLSKDRAAAVYREYLVEYNGETVRLNSHDARRTYAYLCRKHGMSWDALALNMGHSDIRTTQNYVGHDVDWEERIPNWSIEL